MAADNDGPRGGHAEPELVSRPPESEDHVVGALQLRLDRVLDSPEFHGTAEPSDLATGLSFEIGTGYSRDYVSFPITKC